MAFSGHRRSLQLRSQEDDSPTTSAEGAFRESRQRVETHLESSRATVRLPGESPSYTARPNQYGSRTEQHITDNKGNAPTRSLWVGNVPLGIDERSVRSVFERFGSISHIRLPNHARYVFVNYDDVRDAIIAWEECHDRDVYNCDARLNIRFTSSEGEAKEAKRAQSMRKPSIGSLSFVSDNSRPAIPLQDEATSSSSQWPNGRPPAGPRSISTSENRGRPRDISPPSLRRMDSYRSTDRDPITEHSYPRSATNGQDDRPQLYRSTATWHKPGYEYSRKGSLQYASSISASESSLPLDDRRKFTGNAGKVNVGGLKSSHEKDDCDQKHASTITSSSASNRLREAVLSTSDRSPMHSEPSQKTQHLNGTHVSSSDTKIDTAASIRMPQSADPVIIPSPATQQDMAQSSTHPLLNRLLDEDRNANAAVFSANPRTSSPLMRVRKSMERAEPGVARESSVASEVTTSSRSSISRRKRCYGCTVDLVQMALTSCSTCPRRFHSNCGKPPPAACSDDAQFVCGKCLKRQKTALSKSYFDDAEGSKPTQPGHDDLSSDLRSEALVDEADNRTHQVAHDGSHIDREKGTWLALRDDDSYSPFLPPETSRDLGRSQHDSRQADPPSNTLPSPKVAVNQFTAFNDADNSWRRAQDFDVAKKYKDTVTCPYWRRNDCKRSEADCMFAHRDTGIYSPSGKNIAKEWTCPEYFTRLGCLYGEGCLYAHVDTGYYIGIDGKARKKHLTCHWWRSVGRCRRAEEDCLYSHYDTGFYAEDPGVKPMSGSRSLQTVPTGLPSSQLSGPSVMDGATRRRDPPSETIPTSPLTTYHARAEAKSATDSSRFLESLKPSLQLTNQSSQDTGVENKTQSTTHNDDKPNQDTRKVAASTNIWLDPRRAKTTTSTQPGRSELNAGQNDQVPESASSRDETAGSTRAMDVTESGGNPATKIKISVKPCKLCGKNIFSGYTCSKCKLDEQSPSMVDTNTMLPSEPITVSEVDKPNDTPDLTESMDAILEQELPSQDATKTAQQDSRKLKRVLSGNDMFLRNKRSKPSAITPVDRPIVAHIEPVSTTPFHAIDKSNPHASTLTSQANSAAVESQPIKVGAEEESDEEPLALTRRKISRKRDSNGRFLNLKQTQPEDQSNYATTRERSGIKIVIPRRRPIIPDSDEPEPPPTVDSLDEGSNTNKGEDETSAMDEDSEAEIHPDIMRIIRQQTHNSSNEPEDDQSPASFAETKLDQELDPNQLPCRDCSMNHVYCTHRGFQHPMMKQDCLQVPAPGPACDECRDRHKKCLHGSDQSLSGKRCLQWLIERKQRGTTHCDRTKSERNLIEKVATLYEYNYFADNETTSRSATSVEEVFDYAQEARADSYDETDPTEDDEVESMEAEEPKETVPRLSSITQRPSDIPQSKDRSDEDATIAKAVRRRSSTKKRALAIPPRQRRPDLPVVRQTSEEAMGKRLDAMIKRMEREVAENNAREQAEKQKHSYEILKAKGVVFESDSEGEDEPIPSIHDRPAAPEPRQEPSDPLYHRPKKAVSTNLFDVIGRKRPDANDSTPKITKGEGLKGRIVHDVHGQTVYTSGSRLVRQRAMARNLELHSNAHYEVDRNLPDSMVTALVESKTSSNSAGDRLTPPVVEVKEEVVKFTEFLGIGLGEGSIEPCVLSVGAIGMKTLAFRETSKIEKGLGIFGRKRRTGEAGTWPVKDT